jgi:hypothetical protein
MRRIMLNDRLLSVGVKAAQMEIPGGMMPGDDSFEEENPRKTYALGRNL